ncbi:MAG: hypothetical protein SGARI_002698 [Bacillariaceae sp.]
MKPEIVFRERRSWYPAATYFIGFAVNTSTVADLHVDPAYGFGGLGLSVLIHSMFTLYPLSLVSKLAYRPNHASSSSTTTTQQDDQILVWKHTLPMVKPSKHPTTYPLGDITMDKASPDVTKILSEYGGDLQKYEGHLGIQVDGGYVPLLMEIREPSEVRHSHRLLEVLLDPDRLKQSSSRNNRNENTHSAAASKGKKNRKGRGQKGKRR